MAKAIITLPDGRKARLTGPSREAIIEQAQALAADPGHLARASGKTPAGTPPPPDGFVLESDVPPPPGFVLEAQSQQRPATPGGAADQAAALAPDFADARAGTGANVGRIQRPGQLGAAPEPPAELVQLAARMYPGDPEAVRRFGYFSGRPMFVNNEGKLHDVPPAMLSDQPAAPPNGSPVVDPNAQRRIVYAGGQPQFVSEAGMLEPVLRPRNVEGIGDFEAREAGIGQQIKVAAGMLVTMDPKAREDIIRKQIPEAKISHDAEGNAIVELGGERGYLNRPGITGRDLQEFFAQALQFLPAARLAKFGSSLLAKAAIGGATAGATSAGQDVAAGALGSEQGIDPKRAGLTAALGAGAEVASPLVGAIARKLRGTSARGLFDAAGNLTARGERVIREAGFDPRQVTAETAQELAAALNEGHAGPEALAVAQSRRFGVDLTAGQASQSTRQLSREEALAKANTGGAGDRMRGFYETQEQQLGQAARGVQERLAGGQEFANVNEAGGRIARAVSEKAGALKAEVDAAYDAAAGKSAKLQRDSVLELTRRMRGTLRDEIVTKDLHPATAAAIGRLRGLENALKIAPKSAAMTVKQLEVIRRQLNNLMMAAGKNPADKRLLTMMRGELDSFVDEAADRALFTGDADALAAMQKARGLRAEYGKLFEGRAGDAAGRIVQKFAEKDVAPTQAVEYLFGAGELGGKQASLDALKRLERIFGRDSTEWGTLKGAAFARILEKSMRDVAGKAAFSPAAYAKALDRALSGRGEDIMKALYSPDEIKLMREFGVFARLTKAPTFLQNPSNTANRLRQMLSQWIPGLGVGVAASTALHPAPMLAALYPAVRSGINWTRATVAIRGAQPVARLPAPATAAGIAGAATLGTPGAEPDEEAYR